MSRRKRMSCRSASRSIGRASELLGELDPVAIRVVDVEKAHLAGQLEDDPDLDACLAQALRLRLQVGHLDMRDAGVHELSLGEPDLHLAASELRPALLEVDRDLLEAEQLLVEAAALVEVADVVPDGGRQPSS